MTSSYYTTDTQHYFDKFIYCLRINVKNLIHSQEKSDRITFISLLLKFIFNCFCSRKIEAFFKRDDDRIAFLR